jgi:hypothetical protein
MKHHPHVHPDPKAFVNNLRSTMPVWKKAWLIVRNNVKKIVTLSSCCGHPGEPGC